MASKKRIVPIRVTAADRVSLRKASADVAQALDSLAASGPEMSEAAAGKLAAEAKAWARSRKR